MKKKFNKVVNAVVKELKAADEETRPSIVQKLRDVMEEYMVYFWYYNKITPDKTNEELLEIVKYNKLAFYPHEDVYFRKANFVYRFFQPYLVNEECIVTKDMVHKLLAKVNKIIAAAKECGAIDREEKMDKYYYHFNDGENYTNISEKRAEQETERIKKNCDNMPTDWIKVAEEELPTQSGFFFGSTDYSPYYLIDLLSCRNQFEKLLADWKDDEVVYNIMSW